MTLVLALLTGIGQGLLHAMGPDHCAAMATLAAREERRRRAAWMIATRFALGHAVVLGGMAALCWLSGRVLSEALERWAEIGSGLVLIALAATAWFFPAAFEHGHPHRRDHHAGRHLSWATGALMAVSGVRSLTLALPPMLLGGAGGMASIAYLPGFAAGVLVGMAAFGLVVGLGLERAGRIWSVRARQLAALASAVVGIAWIGKQL